MRARHQQAPRNRLGSNTSGDARGEARLRAPQGGWGSSSTLCQIAWMFGRIPADMRGTTATLLQTVRRLTWTVQDDMNICKHPVIGI